MNKIFQIVIFPALLVVSFVTFAEDRGGDRVNNGLVDQTLSEKPAEGAKAGANAKLVKVKDGKDEKCAKDDKECLKRVADLKKKKAAAVGNALEDKKKDDSKN